MTNAQVAAPARTIRLIHAAMVTGVLLFALVSHFIVRPSFADADVLSPIIVRVMLGVALALPALALVLRRSIPRRSTDESADLFWTTAASPAILTWAPLEGASLLAIFTYARTSNVAGLWVAAVVVLACIALNPWYLERRMS